jgi:hypothetical protein
MNIKNQITLTMTKKQLETIVYTMGVALDTDCPAMLKFSDKKIEKIATLYEVLHDMSNKIR